MSNNSELQRFLMRGEHRVTREVKRKLNEQIEANAFINSVLKSNDEMKREQNVKKMADKATSPIIKALDEAIQQSREATKKARVLREKIEEDTK